MSTLRRDLFNAAKGVPLILIIATALCCSIDNGPGGPKGAVCSTMPTTQPTLEELTPIGVKPPLQSTAPVGVCLNSRARILEEFYREADRRERLWQRFHKAIRIIESEDGKRPSGDKGKSNGDYHICRRYVRDALEGSHLTWTYEEVVASRIKSEFVMDLYFWRWCPGAMRRMEFAVLAATHQGGPDGWENMTAKRRDYCDRVLRLMALGDN